MGEFKHGGSSGYSYHKCRCVECVAWKKNWEREYYLRNREAIIARNGEWRKANKPKLNEAQRKRRAADPEAARLKDKERWERDKEGQYLRQKRWNEKNRWRVRFHNWSRNERIRGQEYDPETLEWIKAWVDPVCTYCGGEAETVDHKHPRAMGGTNHRENLTPACNRCNRRKGKMTEEAFWARLRREQERG